jgi:uncharacterized Zn finger protein
VTQTTKALYRECPDCEEETLHEVLKGRETKRATYVFDGVVRCKECGKTSHLTIREAGDVQLPTIVSKGSASERKLIGLAGDEVIAIGDEFVIDGVTIKVTGIEVGARRVRSAKASTVDTLWAKNFDTLNVRFAINMGHKTISKLVEATPTETYTVGDELTFGRLRVRIKSIKTDTNMLYNGTAEAHEIKRIYAGPLDLGPGGRERLPGASHRERGPKSSIERARDQMARRKREGRR